MDPGDWSALRQNFRTNQYYAANISIDGEVVQQVGIRSRGKGSRSGEKPGLKVDMNRYVSGQEFHGRKSVILDNLTQDPRSCASRCRTRSSRRWGSPRRRSPTRGSP